ncbi:MAG: hypothetical protein ABI583_10740 [Betaproteobacteria bacterium]
MIYSVRLQNRLEQKMHFVRKGIAFAFITGCFMGAGLVHAADNCKQIRKDVARGDIVVFENPFCQGRSEYFNMNRETSDGYKAYIGDSWNDKISSIIVGEGAKITIYDNANFGGARATLWPGFYNQLWIYNDKISGFQIENLGDKFDKFVVMYENAVGDDVDPRQQEHTLGIGKFNNDGNEEELLLRQKASMLTMPQGVQVTLYKDYNLKGDSHVFTSPDGRKEFKLPDYGFNDNVKSMEVKSMDVKPPLNGGKPKYLTVKGAWKLVAECGSGSSLCTGPSQAIEVGIEQGKEITEESMLGGSLSLMLGVEAKGSTGAFPGGEVTAKSELTATATVEQRNAIMNSFTTSRKATVTQGCSGSSSLWQWESRLEAIDKNNVKDIVVANANIVRCAPAGKTPPRMNDLSWNP